MISEQTALQTMSSNNFTAQTCHPPIGRHQPNAVWAVVHLVASATKRVAKAPLLPYGALWEASVVLSLVKEREYFEPDCYVTEMPFLTDSWPRG